MKLPHALLAGISFCLIRGILKEKVYRTAIRELYHWSKRPKSKFYMLLLSLLKMLKDALIKEMTQSRSLETINIARKSSRKNISETKEDANPRRPSYFFLISSKRCFFNAMTWPSSDQMICHETIIVSKWSQPFSLRGVEYYPCLRYYIFAIRVFFISI